MMHFIIELYKRETIYQLLLDLLELIRFYTDSHFRYLARPYVQALSLRYFRNLNDCFIIETDAYVRSSNT